MAWDKYKKAAYNRQYYQRNKDKWDKYNRGGSTAVNNNYGLQALTGAIKGVESGALVPKGQKQIRTNIGTHTGFVNVNEKLKTNTAAYRKAQAQALTNASKSLVAARNKRESERMADPAYRAKVEAQRRREQMIQNQKSKAAASSFADARKKYGRMKYEQSNANAARSRRLHNEQMQEWRNNATAAKRFKSNWTSGAGQIASNWKTGAGMLKTGAKKAAQNWKTGAGIVSRASKKAAKSFAGAWKSGVSQIRSSSTYKKSLNKGKQLLSSVMSKFK